MYILNTSAFEMAWNPKSSRIKSQYYITCIYVSVFQTRDGWTVSISRLQVSNTLTFYNNAVDGTSGIVNSRN